MNIKKIYKITILTATSLFVCLITMFIHNNSDLEAVYISLFYIPILMTGLWYYRFTIPLATALTVYCYILDYIEMGRWSINHIYHGFILMFGSLVVYYLSKKLSRTNQELETSRNILAIEKEHLRITLQSIGDGVISTDYNGNVTMLNEVAKNLTGWLGDTAVGRPFAEVFVIINEFSRGMCENIVKNVLKSGKILELVNHTILISKDGIERPIEDSAAPIINEEGLIVGVVLVFRDFSEKREKQKEIEFLSYHDQLTGLYNRRFYDEELARLDIKRNIPLTIVMGDVNGLKRINDSFGHAIGDELLKKAAEVIKNGCRADDIIARLGGDEFIIILPKTDVLEAKKIIERIKDLSLKGKAGNIDISISLGYETKNSEGEDIQEIFKKAEDHMYKNKLQQDKF